MTGTGVTTSNDNAIWRDGTLITREGSAAPGTATGVVYGTLGFPAINDNGIVAFYADLAGATSGTDSGIWRSDGTLIAREGSNNGLPAGASLGFLGSPTINTSGQLAFFSLLTGTGITGANDDTLWRNNTLLVRAGSQAPGLSTGIVFDTLSTPSLNDAGQVGYFATLAGSGVNAANSSSIWRDNTLIAREGEPANGLGGVLHTDFLTPVMNASGQLAYYGGLQGPDVTLDNSEAIWRDTTLIAREGDTRAGLPAGVRLGAFFATVQINDAGQVAFAGVLTGANVTADNNVALWRGTSLIARTGDAAPGQPTGTVHQSFNNSALGAGNQLAFLSTLSGPGVNSSNNQALWIGDGEETVLAAREGDLLDGTAIGAMQISTQSINAFGQVSYLTTLAGSQVVALFTPELRWRRSFSSSWDTASNWTLGLGPAAVHDVRIDPTVSLTVTGPAGTRSVESLQIGGGTGLATLSLAGSVFNVQDGTTVHATGTLAGDGTLNGAVTNFGTVRAQNLTFNNGLTNDGLLIGNGRITGSLNNLAAGQLRVGAGEQFRLVGLALAHNSAGRIEVTTGGLEVDGVLNQQAGAQMTVDGGTARFNQQVTNAGGARIFVDDGTLFFNGGLSNGGQLNVTFGETSLFGAIENVNGGRITLSGFSNTTFFDSVVNKAGGELRVSAGSTAVFFGDVSGSGNFTGTGTKFYEANFAPGSSPGWVVDDGDVGFGGGATLEMELAGLIPGSQHDRLSAGGTLSLDGTLAIILLDDYAPQAGDRYDLLDWTTLLGTFAHIDTSRAVLAPGLAWNFDALYLDGSIAVTAVPLPPAAALFLGAVGVLPGVARRRPARA